VKALFDDTLDELKTEARRTIDTAATVVDA
jgi:hypothetical protein